MPLRPPQTWPFGLANSPSLCRRCLLQFCRARRQSLRSISTAAHQTEAAVAQRRTLFGKRYFLANGFLDETTLGVKRGFLNITGAEKLGHVAAINEPAVSPPKPEQAATSSISNLRETSLEKDILPHRRRKRLRAATMSEAIEPTIPPDASSRLSDISSRLPVTSIRRIVTSYLSLAKPRLSFLIVLTTTASYSLYPVPALLSPIATSSPSLSPLTLLFLTSGTALTCASANALNMLAEPAYDAKMSRTRNRPLVRKLISPRGALIFAVVTGVGGVAGLWFGVNPTVAGLSALNIVLYAGVYTPLKRISVVNTWVGALVGGIPPLMGWAAAAGQSASADGGWRELLFGEGSAGGWLLAALLFCWQFPHFNALSWTIREEYKNAGHRMLAWTNPAMNGRVAFRYALLMVPVCVGLWGVGVVDQAFLVTSSIINGWMIREAWRFWRREGKAGSARGLFWASVWHLPIVLVLAMAHKKGLWEGLWSSIVGGTDEDEDEDIIDEEKLSVIQAGSNTTTELR